MTGPAIQNRMRWRGSLSEQCRWSVVWGGEGPQQVGGGEQDRLCLVGSLPFTGAAGGWALTCGGCCWLV